MKGYIHKIQSVEVFVLKSQFLNRCTLNSSKLMNMHGIVTFHTKIQWKMSDLVYVWDPNFPFKYLQFFRGFVPVYMHAHKNTFSEQFVQYRTLKKT